MLEGRFGIASLLLWLQGLLSLVEQLEMNVDGNTLANTIVYSLGTRW